MDLDDRLDDQSRAVLDLFPPALRDMSDIPAARRAMEELTAATGRSSGPRGSTAGRLGYPPA